MSRPAMDSGLVPGAHGFCYASCARSVQLRRGKMCSGSPEPTMSNSLRHFTYLPGRQTGDCQSRDAGLFALRSKLQFFYPTRGGNESRMAKQALWLGCWVLSNYERG
jgi:hypothetical protein